MADEKPEKLREMHLLDHLEELRSALFASALAWIAVSIGFWRFSRQIFDFLVGHLPIKQLYFYAPAEAFIFRMKLSFILGFLAAFPYIIYRIWRFVSPGLFTRERRLAGPLLASSIVLFYGGVAFSYWYMIPLVIAFLVKYGTGMLSPLFSVDRYFGFIWKLCLAFGIVFQMPVVIIILTSLGIISARWLLRQWRWVVVIIFVAAAVLTPPDPVSQTFMAVPLVVLFFASVAVSLLVERRRPKTKNDGG